MSRYLEGSSETLSIGRERRRSRKAHSKFFRKKKRISNYTQRLCGDRFTDSRNSQKLLRKA